jgi:uncharacterized protein YegL
MNTIKGDIMLTELAIILDRSGSMASVAKDVEGGFDKFIATQRATPNGECRVSLTQFDSLGVETLYSGTPLAEVPALVLEPRGNTPLLDAVGKTVTVLKGRIDREAAPAAGRRVLVLIITDGQENASREYTKAQIKTLVEGQRAIGWDFLYLGANVDAFAEAGGLGIPSASASPYTPTPAGVAASFTSVSSRVASYRAGGGADWTDDERAKIAQQQKPRLVSPSPDKINP